MTVTKELCKAMRDKALDDAYDRLIEAGKLGGAEQAEELFYVLLDVVEALYQMKYMEEED